MPQPPDDLERFAERTDRCEVSLWALRRVVLALVGEVQALRVWKHNRLLDARTCEKAWDAMDEAGAETDAALREVQGS